MNMDTLSCENEVFKDNYVIVVSVEKEHTWYHVIKSKGGARFQGLRGSPTLKEWNK